MIDDQPGRCRGIKANGKRCEKTRLSDWNGQKRLLTGEVWFCSNHKDQETAADRYKEVST